MNEKKYNLEELKSYLPQYLEMITLKRKKNIYNCPLCGSGTGRGKTPAFTLYPEKNSWYCYSCKQNGSIIDLYLDIHQMSHDKENIAKAIEELATEFNLFPEIMTQEKLKPNKTGSRMHIYNDKNGNILARKTITKYSDGSKRTFWSLKTVTGFKNGLSGVKMPLYHTDRLHRSQDPIVYFVEGEKDVETLENCYGFTATSTPNGAQQTSWCDLYNEGLSNRNIIIITDNDKSGENHGKTVARNLYQIAESIKIIPAKAIWSDCPEKGDISDIIQTLGKKRSAQLLADAIQNTELYQPEPEVQNHDCNAVAQNTLPDWIQQTDRGLRVSPELLADYIVHTENYIFVQLQDQESQRCYWYQDGVYTRISAKHLKAKIKAIIQKYDKTLAKVRVIEDTYTHITYPEGKHFVSDETLLDADENIINFQNGVLHLDTMQLEAHSPDYLCTVQIPCNWNPNVTHSRTFHHYIMHLANDDQESARTLIEAIGFSASNVKIERFKKSLILCGAGNSGKSVFLKFMSLLIGKGNFAAMPFEKLDKRFSISTLYRKRLAGDDDCNYCNFSSVSIFKSMTGGGELMCEEKGKQSFPFIFNGLYIICANSLPLFGGDKGAHVYERIIPIRCGATVPEDQRDKKLLEKLYNEREAIVYFAVMELKKAIERNYTFSMSAESKKLLEEYKIKNDIVLQFIDECCEIRTVYDKVTTKIFYDAFKRWCMQNGEKYIPKKSQFHESLCNFYGVEPTREGHNKIQKKIKGNYYYNHTLTKEAKKDLYIYDQV